MRSCRPGGCPIPFAEPSGQHSAWPPAEELAASLRRAGVVEVDASRRRRAEYSSDASLYRVPPLVVAFPRDGDDVAAAVDVARRLGVPATARGAGTSVAGNAIGPGIVLDVRRHLRRIRNIDASAREAVVEPGVVLDDLQRRAAPLGLRFGPDPSTHDRCTLGGMIGNNACGSRALGYGRTVDNVVSLEVVTGEGDRVTAAAGGSSPPSRVAAAALALADAHGSLLRREFDRFSRQVSGYALHHLLPERGRDLAKALVGSEGTCALTLAATVSLVPVPAATLLVVLGYPDMASAGDATPRLLGHDAVAIEGMDARITETVRARRGPDAVPPLPDGGGWLLVELTGTSAEEIRARVPALLADAEAVDHLVAEDPRHARAIWGIREAGAGLVARASQTPSHAGWEDAAVPPEHLGPYLRAFDDLLDSHGLRGVPYGHFGDGCIHVRIDFPFHRPEGTKVFRAFVREAADLVANFGGSISGEHGDGRARGELLSRMYSAEAIAAFGAFKRVFDPDGVLNPDVLVDPAPVDADLRVAGRPRRTEGLGFRYDDDGGDLVTAVHRCTGVGRCVDEVPHEGRVMCPSYLATGDERDSTRGRARVLQEMIDSSLIERRWDAPEVHESLDLCLACKACASDCPTGVDMATYKAEVLHQTYRGRLRPLSHYTLGQLPRWLDLAARAPRWLRRAATSRTLAPLLKAAGGIDQARQMPPIGGERFRAWFEERSVGDQAAEAPEALLWVDTFTDHFTPQVAMASVAVLEDAGYRVRLPAADLCCGLTWITTGQLAAARSRLTRLTDHLADELERSAGPSVLVALEPSCTAVLREDAGRLLGDRPSVRTVAAATRTLAEALAARRPHWQPPRLDGVHVVAQPHCHHHAVMGWASDRALLAACGVAVTEVGGCCGLAGDFGVRRGYHDISARIAETQLLPAIRAAGADAVVLTDGFSCRTQVADLADRTSLHLAELLARAVHQRDDLG